MAIGNVLRQLMDDFQNASEETIIGRQTRGRQE